ncbi:MAG: HIRAN domain-containing protein [Clostridioides sp.]|nr:HIRAN domain-containing protein [Clostridioides sp.]
MREVFVTITGMRYYYGMKPFSIGKKIRCQKDPTNIYDSEAIKVVMNEIGKIGYIANSTYTTITGTMSAGRIYDRVRRNFIVEVMFITNGAVICKVVEGFKTPYEMYCEEEKKIKKDIFNDEFLNSKKDYFNKKDKVFDDDYDEDEIVFPEDADEDEIGFSEDDSEDEFEEDFDCNAPNDAIGRDYYDLFER